MACTVPTERLSDAELARARELARDKSPTEVARVMRLDELTVCRALAGFSVHRLTASYIREYFAKEK